MNINFDSSGPRFGQTSFYISGKQLIGYSYYGSFQIPKNAQNE